MRRMGNVTLTTEELEAMLNRAAKRGARQALEEIGLHDEHAGKDIEDIRGLMASWRETRRTIWRTLIKWVTTAMLGFIVFAVWTQFKNEVGK